MKIFFQSLLKKRFFIALLFVFFNLITFSQTNTWTGATSTNWNTGTNWSLGVVPTNLHDVVIATSVSINVNTNPTINSLTINGSVNVSFTVTGTQTITIDNTSSSIALGSSLTLVGISGGGTRQMNIAFSGTGQTMSIAGTLNVSIAGNDPGGYNATNSVTTVTGTLNNTGGAITSSSTNLLFSAGGTYTHATDGNSIPTATWNATSNCNITGITGTGMAGLNQSFGNFTWDCIGQTVGFLFAGLLTTINGNFTVSNTNTFGLFLATTNGSSYTLTVGGNLIINDNSWLSITLGDNITATVNVAGNFTMTGATSSSTFFDFHPATGVSITMNKIILNVSGNFSESGGQFDFTAGESDAANFAELRIGGNYSLTGTGVMVTSTNDNSITNGTITFNKSGTQTFSSSTPANLLYTNFIIASNSTLELLSNIQLTSEALAVWGGNFIINNGGVLDAGTNQIVSSTGATGGTFNVFTLNSGAGIITANANGIQNTTIGTISTSIETRTFSSAANYTYDGTAIQNSGTFTTTPTANTVNNLTINNSGSSTGVTLQQPFAVVGNLALTNGLLTTTSVQLLILNSAATATFTDGSISSFVNGPMAKIGSTAFVFPVGKLNAGMRIIGISTLSASLTFTAEFIRAAAPNKYSLGTGLTQLSACEHWTLNRTEASGSAFVTLSWNANSPCNLALYVTDIPTLRVGRYNGTQWVDEGNDYPAGATGDNTAGTIKSSAAVTIFSPFALGSSSSTTNPLPVKFVDVKAVLQNKVVRVEWSNLTEQNVEQYIIEKSADGNMFTDMAATNPRTNSGMKESYQVTDLKPVSRTNYYRVKALENTGKIIYSTIVKVKLNETAVEMVVYPNPVSGRQLSFYIPQLPTGYYSLKLISITGQMLLSRTLEHTGGSFSQTVELPGNLSKGIYQLLLQGGTHSLNKKILVE